ncbi:peptide deformylase [Thiotrichales bacterium 19X7-9]|nr:peptide deformylase [Thiotrichales bacterium 19X7-9]
MSLPRVVIMGEQSLIEKSQPVMNFDDELLQLISDMEAVMRDKKGVGIAAPQIGVNKRVILYGFEKNERYPNEKEIPLTVLVNPEYEPINDEMELGMEGCLSVPGLRGMVSRYKHIKFSAFDQTGEKIEQQVSGFHARIIQHEIDHLDGILFPFRIADLKTQFGFESVFMK